MRTIGVTVPTGDLEQLGPVTRPTLVQVGSGGPYVVRGNPISTILDNIRGFCFPAQSVATDDGEVVDDVEYGEFGTPGSPTYMPTAGGPTPTTPPTMQQCGPGTMWDGTQCVLSAAELPQTDNCGRPAIQAAREAIALAIRNCDEQAAAQVLISARTCRDMSAPGLKAAWQTVAGEARTAQATILANRKRGKCMRARVADEPRPNVARIPSVPDIGSMTEGNIDMLPSRDPMQGMMSPVTKRGFGRR